MRFNHPPDTKKLLLGICASLVAVMIWDTIKYHRRLLEFKNRHRIPQTAPYSPGPEGARKPQY